MVCMQVHMNGLPCMLIYVGDSYVYIPIAYYVRILLMLIRSLLSLPIVSLVCFAEL